MGEFRLHPHTHNTQQSQQPKSSRIRIPVGLLGRGTFPLEALREQNPILFPFTAVQPHPLEAPQEWLESVELLIEYFGIARPDRIIVAVEKPQLTAFLSKLEQFRSGRAKKIKKSKLFEIWTSIVNKGEGDITYIPYDHIEIK